MLFLKVDSNLQFLENPVKPPRMLPKEPGFLTEELNYVLA